MQELRFGGRLKNARRGGANFSLAGLQ